jgi:dihydroflavonol-4-reductase
MRCLVTGAAGLIGNHVVRVLLEAGHSVRALHQAGEDVRNLRGLDVDRVAGDVTDADAMRRAARRCDWVFHLAAIYAIWTSDPARMRRVNVEGTRVVLEAARREGVARVVFTSSIARYGGQGLDARATEESPYALGATGDLYAQTKYEAHELAVAAARDQDVVIVAPTGPIGPGDVRPTPTGRLLLSAVTLPCSFVIDSASCFADVRDMARAHLLAAERGKRGEAYLLGAEDVTLAEMARLAQRCVGVERPVVSVPLPVAEVAARIAKVAADRVTHKPPLLTPAAVRVARVGLRADCQKSVRELGVRYRPIRESIRDALEWFSREGYLRRSVRVPQHGIRSASASQLM